jgi:hypothetical protein
MVRPVKLKGVKMEYQIVVADNGYELTKEVKELISKGWEIKGSHQVALRRTQNKFSGDQFMASQNQLEYSQTMIKGE